MPLVPLRDVRTGHSKVIAGNGWLGFGGDGGPATAALFSAVDGLAVDASGNVYISDGNARIRRVGTDGIITTFAGGGTSSADEGGEGGAGPVSQA